MSDRTVRLGGETLRRGDVVVVSTATDGREEWTIARIGTKHIYLDRRGSEVAFEIETRKKVGCDAGYIPRFATRREVAVKDRRRDLVLKLRKFGLQPVDGALGNLGQYSDEALEEVLAVLLKHHNSRN